MCFLFSVNSENFKAKTYTPLYMFCQKRICEINVTHILGNK